MEGKAYILLDSDDEDELVKLDLLKLVIWTPRKRDFFEGRNINHAKGSYLREKIGFHSTPKMKFLNNQFRLPPKENISLKDRFHSLPKGNKGNSPKVCPPS